MNAFHSLSDDELARLVQRALPLPDAPAPLVQRAIAAWPAPAAGATLREAARSAWRRVSAALAFDSAARPQVAWGLRASASDTRHLLFSAEGRDIDLRILPAQDHFSVIGQILGPDTAGSVELAASHEGSATSWHAVPLDGLGEFRLDGVRRGTYRLTLCVGDEHIELPPIDVGVRR